MDYRFTAILIIMLALLALFGGPVHSKLRMSNDEKLLLEQIKEYRNDMVAHNYPFQQISDIITKCENRDIKTISEESQEELEPIITSPMSDE